MFKRIFISMFVLIILVVPFRQYANAIPVATAQTSLDPWASPVNVSRSGSTSEPSLVLDSNGSLHVFWYDSAAESFFYTRREGNEWSTPVSLSVPFEDGDPRFLLYDPQGVIHAFWTNEEDTLFSSYISIESLSQKPTWAQAQFLSNGVMAFDATIDSKGKTHLVYISTEEANNHPAGIYHRSAETLGGKWSNSNLLNESRYFRSLKKETASVKIATTQDQGNDYIFVAWDNRALKQINLIKSTDGGNQWQEVEVIDGPSESSPLEDPFNLLVHAYGSNVLLTWEAGLQSGFDCTQYSQFSSDLGGTWLGRQIMYKNFVGCPKDNLIFDIKDGVILMSTIQDQVYLTAWNGQEWSEPQPQDVLSSFTDPETFITILFRCHQPASDGKQLYVAGCDVEGDGDIWVASRAFDSVSDWFGHPVGWTKPVTLTDSQLNITSPVVICAPEKQVHVFWSQTIEEGTSSSDTAIYHTELDEDGWIKPGRILDKPDTRAVQPAVKIDKRGYPVAVWGSSNDAGIYSSYVSLDKAQNAFNWSVPVQLPSLQAIANSPDILIDQNGSILIAYAIRVNEDRGIYLTRSDDGGKTWIAPIKAFDAVASKWSAVDQPKLTQTSDGILHLIWKKTPVSGNVVESTLYYANSADGGQTWSQPQLVIEELLGSVKIISSGDRTVDLFWISHGNVPGIYHQFSINSGQTWSAPENISGAENIPESMAVIPDLDGRLHLFQATEVQAKRSAIDYLIWNGARWSIQDSLVLGEDFPGHINAIDMCFNSSGQLSAVFTLIQEDETSGALKEGLYFTSHSAEQGSMEAPALTQLVLPTEVAALTTLVPTSAVVMTPTIETTQPVATPSPTPIVPSGSGIDNTESGTSGNPMTGLALGLGLAFVIIVFAVGLVIRNRRRDVY